MLSKKRYVQMVMLEILSFSVMESLPSPANAVAKGCSLPFTDVGEFFTSIIIARLNWIYHRME